MPKMLLFGTVLQQQRMEDFQQASVMEAGQCFNVRQQYVSYTKHYVQYLWVATFFCYSPPLETYILGTTN